MAQRKPSPKKTQTEYMSDDDTSDEEIDPCLQTTPEERQYGTIPASAQATQAALSHTRAQTNPMVKHGPTRENRRNLQRDTLPTEQQKDKNDKKPKVSDCQLPLYFHRLKTNPIYMY